MVTVMSNLGLHEALQRHGIHLVTTPVGDRNVIEWMRREGYNLGGEKSGHLASSWITAPPATASSPRSRC